MENNLDQNQSIAEAQPKTEQWLNRHKSTKHFLVEFFVILFSNLTRFFKQKDEEIEEQEHIKDSIIKHD